MCFRIFIIWSESGCTCKFKFTETSWQRFLLSILVSVLIKTVRDSSRIQNSRWSFFSGPVFTGTSIRIRDISSHVIVFMSTCRCRPPAPHFCRHPPPPSPVPSVQPSVVSLIPPPSPRSSSSPPPPPSSHIFTNHHPHVTQHPTPHTKPHHTSPLPPQHTTTRPRPIPTHKPPYGQIHTQTDRSTDSLTDRQTERLRQTHR